MPADSPAQRENQDDHDLLTHGEAGARLVQEVVAQQRHVAELASSGAPGLEAARTRLEVLQQAVARNQQDRTGHEDYRRVFGDGRVEPRSSED